VLTVAIIFVGATLVVALNARKTDRGKPYPFKKHFQIVDLYLNNTFDRSITSGAFYFDTYNKFLPISMLI